MENSFVKYVEIEEVENAQNLESLVKGSRVEIFEKIDGGLCQIRNIGGQLIAGSKANFLRGKVIRKNSWFSRLVNWMHLNPGFYNLPENLVVFGEWCGHHTIQYDSENIDKFYLIDVYDRSNKRFLKYESAVDLVGGLNLTDVHFCNTLFRGRADRTVVKYLLSEPSSLYQGTKEGLVVKDYESDPQRFFKILTAGFAEKRSKLFGRVDPFTDARIRKSMLRVYDSLGAIPFSDVVEDLSHDLKKELGRNYSQEYISKKVRVYIDKLKKESGLLTYLESLQSSHNPKL